MALFVLFHRPGPGWQSRLPFPEQPGIMDHIGFMRRLDQEQRLVLGGPFDDRPQDADDGGPVGIAIIEADGLAAAEAIAASDQSVKAGLLVVSVRPWRPRMGNALPAD